MPDAKWTPGPWVVAEGSGGYVDEAVGGLGMMRVEGGPERLTLAVAIADVDPLPDEATANARLIAAAPELLAALRAVESCWGYGELSHGARMLVEAALCRAEGGSDDQ